MSLIRFIIGFSTFPYHDERYSKDDSNIQLTLFCFTGALLYKLIYIICEEHVED
jgi:hypothetical protein